MQNWGMAALCASAAFIGTVLGQVALGLIFWAVTKVQAKLEKR